MGSGKVKAHLQCRWCGHAITMCVQVRRGFPPWFACDHPVHGSASRDAGGDIVCEECRRHWELKSGDLTRILEDLLSRDLSDSRPLGAVRVLCPPR